MLLALAVTSTSLERLFDYLPNGKVPVEAKTDARTVAPPPEWPATGSLEFRSVTLRYRPSLAPSLRGASFTVGAGQRCGIVGRTGAGKSTILVALFRLVELDGGSIHIDGLDAAVLGLGRLRRAMSMIPQEAVLMAGTVRDNLDPFAERTDAECAAALAQVGLGMGLLHQQVGGGGDGDGGSSLSVGERQLLAIARALLKKCRVVCMDEPTSHVDAATDVRVQACVAQAFPNATLLVIAHRLHTVAGFDRLVVMADGAVQQVGSPAALLATKGPLADMAAALGPEAAAKLRALAAKGVAKSEPLLTTG
jgi:ABC-type multidrug transport system fused ATPase/permease subunit